MFLLGVAGCVSVTPSVAPNGEPLEARTHFEAVPSELKDNGDFIAAHERRVFDGHLQGATPIDELDFFHIAGDDKSVAQIVKLREASNFATLVGVPVASLGVGAFIGAGALFVITGGDTGGELTDKPEGQAMVGLAFAGAGLMTAGAVFFYLLSPSPLHNEPTDFALPYERAAKAAERYNATLTK